VTPPNINLMSMGKAKSMQDVFLLLGYRVDETSTEEG